MHRLTNRQRVIAVLCLKYIRALPANERPKQAKMADAVGVSQSQLSRYLTLFLHIRFLERHGGTLVEGSRAQDYLADRAVYLLSEAHRPPSRGAGGVVSRGAVRHG